MNSFSIFKIHSSKTTVNDSKTYWSLGDFAHRPAGHIYICIHNPISRELNVVEKYLCTEKKKQPEKMKPTIFGLNTGEMHRETK